MKLNHLDIQVVDVPAFVRFLVEHFALSALTKLDSPKLAILTDGAGFTLVVQQREAASAPDSPHAELVPHGDALLGHIGFLVDHPDEVVAQQARLVDAGVAVSPVDRNARGTRCYLRAHGVLIEVGCNAGSRVDVAR